MICATKGVANWKIMGDISANVSLTSAATVNTVEGGGESFRSTPTRCMFRNSSESMEVVNFRHSMKIVGILLSPKVRLWLEARMTLVLSRRRVESGFLIDTLRFRMANECSILTVLEISVGDFGSDGGGSLGRRAAINASFDMMGKSAWSDG